MTFVLAIFQVITDADIFVEYSTMKEPITSTKIRHCVLLEFLPVPVMVPVVEQVLTRHCARRMVEGISKRKADSHGPDDIGLRVREARVIQCDDHGDSCQLHVSLDLVTFP